LMRKTIVELKGYCLKPFCLVMEYLPNGSLYDFLRNTKGILLYFPFCVSIAFSIYIDPVFLSQRFFPHFISLFSAPQSHSCASIPAPLFLRLYSCASIPAPLFLRFYSCVSIPASLFLRLYSCSRSLLSIPALDPCVWIHAFPFLV
jgi:hypothetical protein